MADTLSIAQAFDLAVQHHKARRFGEAVTLYAQIVVAQPDHADAIHMLGAIALQFDRFELAMQQCQQALAVNPDMAGAHANLGSALRGLGRADEAIAEFRRAIELQPELAEAHVSLAMAYKDCGRLDEAITEFRRAIELRPTDADSHSNLLYLLIFHPDYTPAQILAEHRRWDEIQAGPLAASIKPHSGSRRERRLRIGYLSENFKFHVVALNMLPLLGEHDHKHFEIYCYSTALSTDLVTEEVKRHADHWRDVSRDTPEATAEKIRADKIDILVELSLHMSAHTLLICARKPAPVQVTFAGYPGTTGLRAIDYRLTDVYLDPPGEHDGDYSERSVRLPETFWCYQPTSDEPVVNVLPALSSGRVTFGCLNNICKVNDGTLRLWSRVLSAVPGSRLLLLMHPGEARQRIAGVFESAGIAPSRIDFIGRQPREQYLKLYHRIDIGLDTFPYNGHTTSLDSFYMGVPVVTIIGKTAFSRAGYCQATNLMLHELATKTPEQFVQTATNLAGDLDRLKEMRTTLRRRMERSPLMDAKAFARNIENVYRGMWRGEF